MIVCAADSASFSLRSIYLICTKLSWPDATSRDWASSTSEKI